MMTSQQPSRIVMADGYHNDMRWRVEKIEKCRRHINVLATRITHWTTPVTTRISMQTLCLSALKNSTGHLARVYYTQKGWPKKWQWQRAPQTWWQKEGQAKYSTPGLVRCLRRKARSHNWDEFYVCGQHVVLMTQEHDPKQRMKSQFDTECAVRAE